MTIHCAADPPPGPFQTILFPTLAGDSSEVAQEMFQALHTRLVPGGRLIVSTNAAKGHWIDSQLKALCSRVEQQKFDRGHVFTAWKSAELKKLRGFRARFDFRHLDRVLIVETRPGVFSHRRLDGGARALIRALSLVRDANPPGREVLGIVEMGCGGGAVSAAAAVSFPAARVLAIDSDARAVECTAQTARLNDLSRIQVQLDSEGQVPDAGQWDLLLGNPPYYSDFRIAELFLQASAKGVASGRSGVDCDQTGGVAGGTDEAVVSERAGLQVWRVHGVSWRSQAFVNLRCCAREGLAHELQSPLSCWV